MSDATRNSPYHLLLQSQHLSAGRIPHPQGRVYRYALSLGLEIVDADYNHEAWLEAMRGLEQEPERGGRCLKCFRLRLLDTARYAHEHGFSLITTTLASSRWKSLDQINEAGRYAVSVYPDVIWWDQNWRKGGLSERRLAIIREYGFYNQQYCGCEFSMRLLRLDRNRILLVGGKSFYFDPLFFSLLRFRWPSPAGSGYP